MSNFATIQDLKRRIKEEDRAMRKAIEDLDVMTAKSHLHERDRLNRRLKNEYAKNERA